MTMERLTIAQDQERAQTSFQSRIPRGPGLEDGGSHEKGARPKYSLYPSLPAVRSQEMSQQPLRPNPSPEIRGRPLFSRDVINPDDLRSLLQRRRAKSVVSTQTAIEDEVIPPMPDLQLAMPVPLRTRSRNREAAVVSPDSFGTQCTRSRRNSYSSASIHTFDTSATSSLAPLQAQGQPDDADRLDPVNEDDPGCFDLVAPAENEGRKLYSLEARSDILFSKEHLEAIFADTTLFLKFTQFLGVYRPKSVPVLVYYLDATKAIKAINYANCIAGSLGQIKDCQFSSSLPIPTVNKELQEKRQEAFDVLVKEDLQAYITHIYIQNVSLHVSKRITGTLAPHLRETSEGLAEVFCLTDPSRPDCPIVFASEEFYRTTQYGVNYVIGRNCRFLQGPKTNPFSTQRIRAAIEAGREHYETFLNYRRDGSPFMNLLMCAPLCDSRGKVRYFIGAQIDVSGLVKECAGLESLRRLDALEELEKGYSGDNDKESSNLDLNNHSAKKDEFQDLCEMLNLQEQETVRRCGGRMHREQEEQIAESNWTKPRLLLQESSPKTNKKDATVSSSGKLAGVYQNYLLVRPFPSLRILFASPSLRVPGILQSSFLNKIGGSDRVRGELTQAMAEGRGVTAKIRWISKADEEGRNRWIHCTPLMGSGGRIGVWMVVIVDDEREVNVRKWRQAPPVLPRIPATTNSDRTMSPMFDDVESPGSGTSFFDGLHNERHVRGLTSQRSSSRATNRLSDTSLVI